jgi:hypothetical protein
MPECCDAAPVEPVGPAGPAGHSRTEPRDEGRLGEAALPALGRYFRRMREPRTRVVLSVFRNDGSTASICSKKDDNAGTFCWVG